jgi:membrane-bound ClpP family serine protease
VTAFLVIGAVGLAIVVISLVLGDLFDGVFGDVDLAGGAFSSPVLGSFLASFGFGAALIQYSTDANATVAALGGLVSGLVVGALALFMTRSLMHMPTDATVTTSGLEGRTGIIVSAIPQDGYGQVTLRHHGEQRMYNARATDPIAAGTPVRVTAVLSSSAVQVVVASD